jgi:hypothetical protein
MNTTTEQATAVEIIEKREAKHGNTIEAKCGKVTATVGIYQFCSGRKQVTVICQNSMHRAWRGMGRDFGTVFEAMAAYKSAAMKSIIQAAAIA